MPRILLVEDNEPNRDMLSRRLIRGGFEVITALDGLEGIERARDGSPDLILMDLGLPEVDGWEAARSLRADPSTCTIPIVALTAHAMESDRRRALSSGFCAYATKPVEFESLVKLINERLGAAIKTPS